LLMEGKHKACSVFAKYMPLIAAGFESSALRSERGSHVQDVRYEVLTSRP
jgi:hypothetical protein